MLPLYCSASSDNTSNFALEESGTTLSTPCSVFQKPPSICCSFTSAAPPSKVLSRPLSERKSSSLALHLFHHLTWSGCSMTVLLSTITAGRSSQSERSTTLVYGDMRS